MVRHSADTDRQFYDAVPEQWTLGTDDHLARHKASDGKAAHINAERKHLAVAGMPQEKFKVSRPRAFVN